MPIKRVRHTVEYDAVYCDGTLESAREVNRILRPEYATERTARAVAEQSPAWWCRRLGTSRSSVERLNPRYVTEVGE